MTTTKQIISHIQTVSDFCKNSQQRAMLVVSGEKDWCLRLIKELAFTDYLAVSHRPLFSHDTQSSDKLSLVLGKEYTGIIWDGFSGLSPNGLGIASGLLKRGGLFLLLLPPLDFLRANPDQDYARMCSENLNIQDFNTFFLQRLVDKLEHAKDIFIFQENEDPSFNLVRRPQEANQQPVQLPTNDQCAAIDAIKKVAFGHRHRPLVIQANRGRGKSSALGLAAAEIFLSKKFKTIITAPSKKTCEAAFTHYHSAIKSIASPSSEEIASFDAGFEFLPLDFILDNNIDCHMLFIDEAAAIPASILNALVGRFSRVVYSTTIHGYEGNGQGFAIRFKQTLDKHYSQWNSLTLNQPIRWLESDTLEPWFFRFLLLDARLSDVDKNVIPALHTMWISQQTLYEDDDLFEQIISLLVTAHYQTSPSDIRLILDHPHVKILISYANLSTNDASKRIYGVCLVIEEGGINSIALANDIISGKRRPRGQLFPQALCASSGNADFMHQHTYRVMRIAVHPAMQQKGIGSTLLGELKRSAQEKNIDSLSTSYGLSSELLSFWNKNQFGIVKLGTKVDGSSGLRSVMMMRPISTPAMQLLTSYTEDFFDTFMFNLNRQHNLLSTNIIATIIQSMPTKKLMPIKEVALRKINAFATASRPLEETSMELFYWLIQMIPSSGWKSLSEDKQELLISQILQNRDYKNCLKHSILAGKKQKLTALRQAVTALLNTEA